MKIKFYLFPILALILTACESPSPEMPDLGIMGMQLVRFKSSEHIQYVAVEEVPVEFDTIKGYPSDKLVGTKSAYKIRGAGGVCQELFLGHSPYIELVNDYFLVDWKWGNFIYKPSNVLIDVAWQGVQDRQQIWDLQTDVISNGLTGNVTKSIIGSFNIQWQLKYFDGAGNAIVEITASNSMTAHSGLRPPCGLGYGTFYTQLISPAIDVIFKDGFLGTGIGATKSQSMTWTIKIPKK